MTSPRSRRSGTPPRGDLSRPKSSSHRYVIDQRWYSTEEVHGLIVQTLPKLKPNARTCDQLVLHLGSADLSQGTLSRMLKTLAKKGVLDQVAHGRYTLPAKDPR
ncbi:hypothetical protein CcrJ4_gp470 [Caulobacter phage J4]|nr:hypothetical protein CcrJ4_gp470 [Caulobacter phage J4]UTU10334.1 hypothetical protein CcrRB23_gp472 [Caulobacter phage RB23]